MGSFINKNAPPAPQAEPPKVEETNQTETSTIERSSLSKKDWFVLVIISLLLFSIGSASGWYLSSFNSDNFRHKLTQTSSALEAEKKQTSNALKKNVEIQKEFQNKLASLSLEFVNLKNTYQSNMLAKDEEMKLIKNNLPTNYVVNTITNIVTTTVTNKIPSTLDKFRNELVKRTNRIDSVIVKEQESEESDIDKIKNLERNKKIITELILDVDKFKEKNTKDINSFIESKIKFLTSKGITYTTNKSDVNSN